MPLYVANCTNQNHIFPFLIPEDNKLRHKLIPMGGQALIYRKDATREEMLAIVKQHEVYGITDVDRIDQRRGFTGMCFSLDKPINVAKIMSANQQNIEAAAAQASQQRQDAAAAMHHIMLDNARRDNMPIPRAFEMEVEEVTVGGDRGAHETIEIVQPGVEPRGGRPIEAVQASRNGAVKGRRRGK